MSTPSPVIDAGGGIVVLGGGGHASGIMNLLNSVGLRDEVAGFLDDRDECHRMQLWGIPHLGKLTDSCIANARIGLGVGLPNEANMVLRSLRLRNCTPQSLIHPDVSIAFGAELLEGVAIFAGSRISPFACIGSFTHLGQNASFGHDTAIGSTAAVMAGATIGGDCNIGDRVMVGISATVLPGLRIGDDARIGAGAVVTKDVEAGQTVVGIPARPIRDQAGDN